MNKQLINLQSEKIQMEQSTIETYQELGNYICKKGLNSIVMHLGLGMYQIANNRKPNGDELLEFLDGAVEISLLSKEYLGAKYLDSLSIRHR